jgi:hypothetical protein
MGIADCEPVPRYLPRRPPGDLLIDPLEIVGLSSEVFMSPLILILILLLLFGGGGGYYAYGPYGGIGIGGIILIILVVMLLSGRA